MTLNHARSIVTVDLDSTLCDTGHRHGLINANGPTDWTAYSMACANDAPIEATVMLVNLLSAFYEVHFVTGRDEDARHLTEPWLDRHIPVWDGLWMDDTDEGHTAAHGSHAEYKLSRIKHVERVTGKKVVLHVDDWPEVKNLLENNGYLCLCVKTPQEIALLIGDIGAV